MEVMQRITEHLRARPVELEKLKVRGEKKIVAHFVGDYVPTEIIYAAGAIPLGLIHGGDPESVEAAHNAIIRYLCPFAKAQFGYWVLGEQKYYEMFDLLIAPVTCQHLRRAADLYRSHTDLSVYRLGVPKVFDGEHGVSYYTEGLKLLAEKLEGLTGNPVTDGKLKEAIQLYHGIRDLLKKISELRKLPHPPITTTEFIRLNHAAHVADPHFMLEMLEILYQDLNQKEGPVRDVPRILITGPNIALGDSKVLDLVEASGGMIVAEDIAEGVLFYWENVDIQADPYEALTDRYLRRRPNCSFEIPGMERHFDFILKLAKDFSVDAILWYQLRMCETWDIEAHFFAQKLKEMGTPIRMIKLDSEYDISDTGQLKTRIEAFIDTVKRRTDHV